jgi:uncharacterized protein YyaL (SSP411 family)
MPNRLARERSPYLLQHAGNPVDWYPWGEEAFAKARDEDKPIFLSVGYSTCHWCHVMEHESFEHHGIADLLNRHFVAIKVDREERPDVDRVYMTFVQATTGAGGWPMSVWLTPQLKPFFGGTYFPPSSRWGRPGFGEVLAAIARAWEHDRQRIEGSADAIMDTLRAAADGGGGESTAAGVVADARALAAGVDQFELAFDRQRGGFGDAPKFPRPSELLFLLGEFARTADARARAMALETLRAMALGGMRDHVGGGFHRYSVDAEWRVPHFEKMLYDQAQLALAFLEAAQLTGDPLFAAVAVDTLDYVARDLAAPEGGFFSAEDADSVPPERAGEPAPPRSEGAYYIWSDAEIDAVAGEDADLVRLRFDVRPDGNAPQDPQGEFQGKNLLYVARTIEEVADISGRSIDTVIAALGRARQALFSARQTRPRPRLDDKVLTAWNGLAVAAFARAARVLPEGENARRYLDLADRAAAFIRAHLWNGSRQLLERRYGKGEAAIDGYAEDYACLIWGLLELFQTGGNPAWLEWAVALQDVQNARFWDAGSGGWFSTTGSDPTVLLRLKEDYDGAEPAASSVGALNEMMLAHLTAAPGSGERAERTLARLGSRPGQLARAMPMMGRALATWHAGLTQVVLVGEPGRDDLRALQRVVASTYLPFAIVVPVSPATQPRLGAVLPWIAPMTMREGRATAYVCRQFACNEPVTSAVALAELLQTSAAG